MRYLLSLILVLTFAAPAMAYPTLTTSATAGIVLDADTGQVLWALEPQTQMPTSSMSKVMTEMVVYDAIKSGQINLQTQLPVSEKAWRMQGSKMFVALNSQVSVDDLLHGLAIQSGNDACIVLAEGVAGSEESFVERINEKAKAIGMTRSHFMNSTGWPDPQHYSTPEDLAIMARYLINNYPEEYKINANTEFTYNNIKQGNRNPLLGKVAGADGVKTGHTDIGGYGLIGSAKQGDRRIIIVMNGWPSIMARFTEGPQIMTWAFTNFKNINIAKANTPLLSVDVAYGKQKTVPVGMFTDVKITQPVGGAGAKLRYVVKGKKPLMAPVEKGAHVADLNVMDGDKIITTYPLVALEAAEKGSFVDTIRTNMMSLLKGQ